MLMKTLLTSRRMGLWGAGQCNLPSSRSPSERAQVKWGAAGKDAWGHYPNEEDHFGLFEQIRCEQEERNRSASNATTFYNSKEWRRLRYQAFRKYGNKCSVCGRGASEGMVMNVEHIKPRSLHPHLALELSNLQIMSHECNLSKSYRDEIKWG